MIPYKDDNPTRLFPVVTLIIICCNIMIFLIEIVSPCGMKTITYTYGAIPQSLISFQTQQPLHPLMTVFTSRLGHVRFVIFYLFCGIFAAYSYAITNPASTIPMVGASGAISGILGAYLLLFPRANVHTLVFLGFFVTTLKIPALIVIGFWAIIQFINGIISSGLREGGGVAWFAHLGGFLIGLATLKLWLPRRDKQWS